MTVLVTGAAGFIGSHLLDRLGEDNAYGIDKRWGTSTAKAKKLRHIVRDSRPSVIVHLGANCSSQISLRDPELDFTDNVVGTFNVCEVAREYGIPVIFNSTMKVTPGVDGIITPYGRSKLVGEDYLRLYHDIYGLPYIINRPSSVYGPRQNGSDDGGWFTWFIRAAMTCQTVNLYGDGTQSRDVLYIDDHIDLLIDQIRNFDLYSCGEFDFGGGPENEVSLLELLDKLEYDDFLFKPRLVGDVQRFVNDNAKVTAVNGWRPTTGWRMGLKKTRASMA